MPRCFVISPIGAHDSDIRQHADDVFHHIIQPAATDAGCDVYRADHEVSIGKITNQMITSIINDDVIIAVISFDNPNVFYELGVAQSAGRNVVMLNLRGHRIPFDIKDFRIIEYDFRPGPIRDGLYVRNLTRLIKESLASRTERVVPFGSDISPLGAYQSDFVFHERYADLPLDKLAKFFTETASAREWINMSGISLRYLLSQAELQSILFERVKAGATLRVLLMHEENEALGQMLAHMPKARIDNVRTQINENAEGWKALGKDAGRTVEVRKLRRGIMYQQMFLTPASVMVASYSYSAKTSECPVVQASRRSALYQLRRAEFEALWHSNAE